MLHEEQRLKRVIQLSVVIGKASISEPRYELRFKLR
jgi:hypothetical protein